MDVSLLDEVMSQVDRAAAQEGTGTPQTRRGRGRGRDTWITIQDIHSHLLFLLVAQNQ